MKKSFYKIVVLLVTLLTVVKSANSQAPVLTCSVSSVQTGTPFFLDVQVTYNATCGTPSLQMNLPSGINLNPFYISVGAHPWSPSFSVSSSTLTVNFSSAPTSGSVTTNFQINLEMLKGLVCNNTVFNFKVDFITVNCGTITSNQCSVTGLASNKFTITSTVADGDSCVGGYMFYDISVINGGQIGAYNLTSASITFNTNGASICGIGVVNSNNIITSSVSYTTSGTNVTWNIGTLNVLSSYWTKYRICVYYPCGTFNAVYTGNHAVTLSGTNPCSTISTATTSQPVSLPVNCCSTPGNQPLLQKSLTSWVANFCPGACQTSTYSLTFNNVYSTSTYSNVVIEDVIPAQDSITSFVTDIYSQYTSYPVSVTWQKNGVATWLTGTTVVTPNTTTPVTSLAGWTAGDYVSRIRWVFTSVLPGVAITNNLNFFVINPDHNSLPVNPSDIITNTMLASASSPAFSSTINLPKTVNACPTPIYQYKYINNSGTIVTSQNALPGDTVRFRMIFYNASNSNVSGVTVQDVLNPNFTYVPASDSIYYGSSWWPTSTMFASLPNFNATSPPTGTIVQTSTSPLTWTVPILPGSCTSSKFLIFEFSAKVNAFTPAGSYPNKYTVNGNFSNTVFVNVNSFYRAEPYMYVQCPYNGTWDSTANAKPGDVVQFKYKIKNVGNVNIDQIRLVNTKPMLSDLQVVNYTVPRNSQFNIDYNCSYSPVATPFAATPSPLQYSPLSQTSFCRVDMNMPGMPTSCTNPVWSTTCNSSQNEMRIALPPAFILTPGNDVDIVVQGTVSATATLGQIANNSFGFIGRRMDISILTNPVESNLAQVIIDSTGCPQEPQDTCHCGEWISHTWQYMNSDIANPPTLPCGGQMTVNCNQPFMITPQYSCAGPNCAATYSLTINSISYPFISGSFSNISFSTPGTYSGVLIAYCNGIPCDTCRFTIKVNCPPTECTCKSWQSITMTTNQQTTQVQCLGQYNVNCNSPYTFTFNYSCTPQNCSPKFLVKMNPPGGPFTMITGNTWNFTFTTSGWYTLTVIPICGTDTCQPCVIRFKADCPQDDCVCGQWGNIIVKPTPLPNVDYHPFPVQCGNTYDIDCNMVFAIQPQYYCSGVNCNVTYTMTINSVSYPFNTGSGSFENISFSTSGLYTVTITPFCNGVPCPPCKIYFKVDCGVDHPPDCCKQFNADVSNGKLTYTSGSMQNLSLTGINVSGMTPNKMTITVVSAIISSSTCGQNGPVAAGISAITTNTTGLSSFYIINQPYGRDISLSGTTWNNSSNTAFNLYVPLKPGCKDVLTVCVKITFYDKNCKACSIYKCFSVQRKWKKIITHAEPLDPVIDKLNIPDGKKGLAEFSAILDELEKKLNEDNNTAGFAINNTKSNLKTMRLRVSSLDQAFSDFDNTSSEANRKKINQNMMLMNMQFLALQHSANQLGETYNTLKNIMKLKHDAMMAAIQNIR